MLGLVEAVLGAMVFVVILGGLWMTQNELVFAGSKSRVHERLFLELEIKQLRCSDGAIIENGRKMTGGSVGHNSNGRFMFE